MSEKQTNKEKDPFALPKRPQETIFRKAAMERVAVREELDDLFRPTPMRRWVPLLAGALLLAAAVVWAVWGRAAAPAKAPEAAPSTERSSP